MVEKDRAETYQKLNRPQKKTNHQDIFTKLSKYLAYDEVRKGSQSPRAFTNITIEYFPKTGTMSRTKHTRV